MRDTGEGYVRTVNGRVDRFDEPWRPGFLEPDTFKRGGFFSAVEDKARARPSRMSARRGSPWRVGRCEAQHYRMTGDEEREPWFESRTLAKVAFRRDCSTVEDVRDQIEPLPPQSSCTVVR